MNFNHGEYAVIRSKAVLNNYKIGVKEWVEINRCREDSEVIK